MNCDHRRYKKIYNHGRKYTPIIKCKDCGVLLTPNELAKKRKKKRTRYNKK